MTFKPLSWVLAPALLALAGCGEKSHTHAWWAMDSNMSLTLFGASREEAEKAFVLVEAETQRLAELFTNFSDHSPVSRMTGKAGDTLPIPAELALVLQEGLAVSQASAGAFDMTLHALKWAWGLGDGQPGRLPDSTTLDSIMAGNPTYRSPDSANPYRDPVSVLPGSRAVLNRSQTRLDLGAIAKGHIVDRLHGILDSLGYGNHLIQAGGEIRVGGHKPDKPWLIGIRHPRLPDSLCGMIRSPEGISVSTSGDYERFFMKDGKRYHHIFNPRTGHPAQECVAVTVMADRSILADALSTALFVQGPEKGQALARKFNAKAVWFRENAEGVCAMPMPEIKASLTLLGMPVCPAP